MGIDAVYIVPCANEATLRAAMRACGLRWAHHNGSAALLATQQAYPTRKHLSEAVALHVEIALPFATALALGGELPDVRGIACISDVERPPSLDYAALIDHEKPDLWLALPPEVPTRTFASNPRKELRAGEEGPTWRHWLLVGQGADEKALRRWLFNKELLSLPGGGYLMETFFERTQEELREDVWADRAAPKRWGPSPPAAIKPEHLEALRAQQPRSVTDVRRLLGAKLHDLLPPVPTQKPRPWKSMSLPARKRR